MSLIRQIARDMVAALSVLALVFLSFGAPPSAAHSDAPSAGTYEFAGYSFCGGDPGSDQGVAHGACHSCRVTIAELPAPPCVSEPAYAAFIRVEFRHIDAAVVQTVDYSPHAPRAPPVAV